MRDSSSREPRLFTLTPFEVALIIASLMQAGCSLDGEEKEICERLAERLGNSVTKEEALAAIGELERED